MYKLIKTFFSFVLFILLINNLLFSANIPKQLKVQINSSPQGVTVYSKGMPTPLGTTPLTSQFMQGRTYTLTFTKQGYKDQVITYRCDGNPIFVNLEKIGGGGHSDDNNQHERKKQLTVNSNINGANVFANGNNIGNTPLTAKLREGTYNIRVSYPGFTDYNTSVNLNSNQQIYANLQAMQYKLSINSNVNNAIVYINGNKSGNIPFTAVLSPGTYNVSVRHHGFKDFNTTVNLSGDQTIYANLVPNFGININIPNGAQLYINGEKQNVNWGQNEFWKVFYFTAFKEFNQVKIKYHGIEVEKSVKFDNRTISLIFDIN